MSFGSGRVITSNSPTKVNDINENNDMDDSDNIYDSDGEWVRKDATGMARTISRGELIRIFVTCLFW